MFARNDELVADRSSFRLLFLYQTPSIMAPTTNHSLIFSAVPTAFPVPGEVRRVLCRSRTSSLSLPLAAPQEARVFH